MTLEQVVAMLAFIAFAICSVTFISRISSSRSFRNQIATPRNFAEGCVTGIAYPLWILVYGMIFIQSTAFLAFPTSDELSLNRRVIILILSLTLFFLLRACTLPLLGVWLGKTGIWVSHGTNGLIKFENLTYCEIVGVTTLNATAPTSVCTLIFRAKGRHLFFHTRKYACKVAFGDLIPYLDRLPIDDSGNYAFELPGRRFETVTATISYALSAIIALGSIGFLVSTALLSPYTYTEHSSAIQEEIHTFTPITDAYGADGLIVVRYKHVESINVYSEEDGQYKWSLSRKRSFFTKDGDGISIRDGVLKYTVGGVDRFFSLIDGAELSFEQVQHIEFPAADALRDMNFEFHPLYIRKQLSDSSYRYIVSRPTEYTLFIPSVAWGILLGSLLALYLTRLIAAAKLYKKSPSKAEINQTAENFDLTETELT